MLYLVELMYKKEDDWFSTKKGKEQGGSEKEGQYGKFVVWPEEIKDLMQHTDTVAEIQNTLRVRTDVKLTAISAVSVE